jgi:hypothetical protein
MINKTNIDVQIYLDNLMEGVNQSGILEMIMEEFEVEKESLKEILTENFTLQSCINFEETGDPELDEDQFEEIIGKSALECTVESMVQEGILVKSLEEGGTENSYSINPEIKGEVKKYLDEEDDNEESSKD